MCVGGWGGLTGGDLGCAGWVRVQHADLTVSAKVGLQFRKAKKAGEVVGMLCTTACSCSQSFCLR